MLIIEDSPATIETFKLFTDEFMVAGIRMIFADSLEEARRLIAENSIEIILVDLNLGDSTGIETLDRVVEKVADNTVPIFVFTGADDAQLRDLAHGHGAEGLFLKGEIVVAHLISIAHYAAGQSRARKRLRKERDDWKEKCNEADSRFAALLNEYNAYLEGRPTESEHMEKMGTKLNELRQSIQSLAASH